MNNPANLEDKSVLVMVGTRKGVFVFSSDFSRKKWRMSDLMFRMYSSNKTTAGFTAATMVGTIG